MHTATLTDNLTNSLTHNSFAGRTAVLPETLTSLTDEQIVNKCKAGSRAAFDELIRRYERPIFHIAYRLSGNSEDASDIAAEAFLRIFRSIGTCHYAVTLPAWIKRIVVNVYFDSCRRAKRHPAVSFDALTEKTGDSLMIVEENERQTPQGHVELEERKSILRRAISALPDYQRKMVLLFHSEGRTYEEIADIMRIPVGTVKSRLNRARLALRDMLTPHLPVLVD
jgi:RNA polymerase sigma-70 factor (ECF subfamily)